MVGSNDCFLKETEVVKGDQPRFLFLWVFIQKTSVEASLTYSAVTAID
jgi:hypothetical protein